MAASRPATTSWSRSRRVIVAKVSGRTVSMLALIRSRPASARACAVRLRPERVGGERGLDAERVGAGDDVDQTAAQQRLAAGEAHLADPEPLDPDRDQPHDLVVGERLVGRQPVEALGRHAVVAPQVAPVGQGHAQVRGHAAEAVCQRCRHTHHPSEAPSTRLRTSPDNLVRVHKLRFLVSRRWIAFALVVVFLAWVAWRLGEWQFDRLEDRQDRNAIIERNEEAGAAPDRRGDGARDATSPRDDEWRIVEATGTYAVEDTVIVRYRTREGAAGVDVVVPARAGRRLQRAGRPRLVRHRQPRRHHRGRARAAGRRGRRSPAGCARTPRATAPRSATSRRARSTAPRSARRSTARCSAAGSTSAPSRPSRPTPLAPVELPELNNGPHFFYGLQWWFFGALADLRLLLPDVRRVARRARSVAAQTRDEARPVRRR